MRVVLESNVVISALLFERGRLSRFRLAWTRGQIVPVVSSETVAELIRVLAYPKFQLTEEEVEVVLAAFLPYAEAFPGVPRTGELRCRDVADQKFLDLAEATGAEMLVAGDEDLLCLRENEGVAFEIVEPAEFLERLSL